MLSYLVPAATLAAVLFSLAIAPASAAPASAGSTSAASPRTTDCSGVLQCATVTLPAPKKSSGMGLDRPWYRQGFQPSDRADQYPRGTWYKPYPGAPNNVTPRW
jgi:hypothetical protein